MELCKQNQQDALFFIYTEYTEKNFAFSKVNEKFISHLTRAQRTPSAAASVQVSPALQAVRFSGLLRGLSRLYVFSLSYPAWKVHVP